jgi:predicted amidohydrolase YtcJ
MTAGMLTRRQFTAGMGALFFLRLERTRPSLVLWNGNIHTMEPGAPRAQAVAIADGRFLAVGSNAEILALGGGAPRVDLGGKTVVPGFIDAHSHPAEAGLGHLRSVDCDLRSIDAIVAALRERAARTPPGAWVFGFKYDDTKTREGRWLTARDLDGASTRHPIYVEHRGGHTAYVNTLALARAGISERTADPPGGHVHRDASGLPSGRIEERATERFEALFPHDVSIAERRKGIALISKMMARTGITSVTDAYTSPEMLRAYREAHASGELLLRVYCLMDSQCLDRMIDAGVATGFGDEWVRVGAQKQTCDGSISERTARLSQAYLDRPGYHGIVVTDEEQLYERARKAHAAGWQNAIHANGDGGIDIALRVYERLQKDLPRRDPRYRLEHCTVINDALVARMRALGAIPNPFSTYVYYHGEKMKAYGAERLESMFAVRSFLDAGLRPTMTSDYPPGPFEPMMALQSMVTRTDWQGTTWGPRQRISVAEALRVGTLHGAYASFEEDLKGSIRPGKLADLVVLGADPMRALPSQLMKISVERTMIGGRWVFES